MKALRFCGWAILSILLSVNISSCSNDDELNAPTNTTTTVQSSTDENGVLVGNGLKFRITSFTENTAGVYGTSKEVDKATFTGGFEIPAYIVYAGNKYAVTSIEKEAFYRFNKMTSVIIPATLKKICKSAFYGCSALTSATIPNSVTEIEEYAFYECLYQA